MKILHYSLGFPPFRRGGLVKYCMDIMSEQILLGHDVAMLWPGGNSLQKTPRMKEHKAYKYNGYFIKSYEITNVLPVPLLEGIKTPCDFMRSVSSSNFEDFLRKENPDILHFHTIMGIPLEFMNVLEKMNIKTVYTTHDYFGLCFRTTFMNSKSNSEICKEKNCRLCASCNANALSTKKLYFLQSNIYRYIKETSLIQWMRRKHFENHCIVNHKIESKKIKDLLEKNQKESYENLREYYIEIFKKMSCIHFNSENTKNIYNKYLSHKCERVISITHSAIENNVKIKRPHNPIHISYLGPKTEHKGYYLLKKITNECIDEGIDMELHVYFNDKNVKVHNPYKYSEIDNVMENSDVIVVPSLWNETFGFIVLEALSYGVPVIVSGFVGAKDIVKEKEYGYIIQDEKELKEILLKISSNTSEITKMNKNICSTFHPKTIRMHCIELGNLYCELL